MPRSINHSIQRTYFSRKGKRVFLLVNPLNSFMTLAQFLLTFHSRRRKRKILMMHKNKFIQTNTKAYAAKLRIIKQKWFSKINEKRKLQSIRDWKIFSCVYINNLSHLDNHLYLWQTGMQVKGTYDVNNFQVKGNTNSIRVRLNKDIDMGCICWYANKTQEKRKCVGN